MNWKRSAASIPASSRQRHFKPISAPTVNPVPLQAGLDRLCRYAVDAVEDGFEVLILTDRAIDSDHAPIPSLLACSAVHHHLIRKGYRGQVGIIVEAGDVWEVHHFACLIGFGATAINPYLALSTIRDLKLTDKLKTDLDAEELKKNYIKAVCEGLLKVFSKMGISTLQSYQGAQIFEIIGLNRSVVDKYFTGATSRIEGMGLDEIARETLTKHFFAFSRKNIPVDRLPVGGIYQWKRKGEFHLFNPATVHLLQYSTRMNDYDAFKKYSKLVNDQSEKAATLRSMITFKRNRPSITLDEVEPAESHLPAIRHRRHVLWLYLTRSPLHPRHRHEPPRRKKQYRRRRRRRTALRTPAKRRFHALRHQAGGLRPLRRHQLLPHHGRRTPDQDGPGRQARRRRPAPRP